MFGKIVGNGVFAYGTPFAQVFREPRFSLRNLVSHGETRFLTEKPGFSLAVCTSKWKPVISLKITGFPRTMGSQWRNAQIL